MQNDDTLYKKCVKTVASNYYFFKDVLDEIPKECKEDIVKKKEEIEKVNDKSYMPPIPCGDWGNYNL
jgi:hypothetical protein